MSAALATTVFAVAAGLVVGLLSGMLGIGGGTLMIPVFRLGFGLGAIEATATSLFTIVPTSLAGIVAHVRGRTCVVPLGLAAGIGGALTSPVGVWLASKSPSLAIMGVAGAVIAYSAITTLHKALKGSRSAPAADPPARPSRKRIAVAACSGLVAGVVSGYVGVGGGFLIVPLLTMFSKLDMRHAAGTSLLAVMLLAIPATITQGALGNIDYLAGIAMIAGSIPGALLGARLQSRIPERSLRLLFGCLLLVAAALLVANEVSVLRAF